MLSSRLLIVPALILVVALPSPAADPPEKMTSGDLRRRAPEWFTTDQGVAAIDGVVAAQLPTGGWRKGYNVLAPEQNPDKVSSSWSMGTFDNHTTYTEVRFLAEAFRQTQRPDVLHALHRGLDFIFDAQYPSGGWPQRWPESGTDYGSHITLNDHAMIRVLELLHDVATDPAFAFVDPVRRSRAQAAFNRGVQCLLELQIEVDGRLTGWAQQYDHETLEPTHGRAYELPSIASDETVGVLRVLMRIDDPGPDVRRAVHAGVKWLEDSKVTGIRLVQTPDPSLPKGFDLKAVEDPDAQVLWSRFYEIETNRPFFCGRDGAKTYSLNEIDAERRSGYAWLRPWAKDIPKEYAQWKARVGE